MVGQKQRIINRFRREAKKKYKLMEEAGIKITCLCSKPKWHLVQFSVDEIEKIINFRDSEVQKKGCGNNYEDKGKGLCLCGKSSTNGVMDYCNKCVKDNEGVQNG